MQKIFQKYKNMVVLVLGPINLPINKKFKLKINKIFSHLIDLSLSYQNLRSELSYLFYSLRYK